MPIPISGPFSDLCKFVFQTFTMWFLHGGYPHVSGAEMYCAAEKIKYLKDDSVFSIYSHFNVKYHKFKKFNLDMESFFLEFNSILLNE